MPQRVVDVLEMIKIDIQHRAVIFVPFGIGDFLVEVVPERTAVGQLGQRILVGLFCIGLFQLFFQANLVFQFADPEAGGTGL